MAACVSAVARPISLDAHQATGRPSARAEEAPLHKDAPPRTPSAGKYDPSSAKPPDPERWIPKKQRSYNKLGRKNKGKFTGAQGGAADARDAAKLDAKARADVLPRRGTFSDVALPRRLGALAPLPPVKWLALAAGGALGVARRAAHRLAEGEARHRRRRGRRRRPRPRRRGGDWARRRGARLPLRRGGGTPSAGAARSGTGIEHVRRILSALIILSPHGALRQPIDAARRASRGGRRHCGRRRGDGRASAV